MDVIDCVFRDQYSEPSKAYGIKGTALGFVDGTLRVLRTEFIDNIGTDGASPGGVYAGGALYLGNGASLSATLTNCLFRGNLTPHYYGSTDANKGIGTAVNAQLNASRSASFVNCTFAANTNTSGYGQGGAIYVASGTVNLKNCILWGNEATGANSFGDEIYNAAGTMNVTYSDLTGTNAPYVEGVAVTITDCITEDPLFASATDVHLQSKGGRWDPATGTFVTSDSDTSPCIDAGEPGSIRDEPTDNGNSIINMGYYGGTAEASKTYAVPGALFIVR